MLVLCTDVKTVGLMYTSGDDSFAIPVETQEDFAYTVNGDAADIPGITITDNLQEFVISPAE